jgi:glycine/D-amino acid oxidase-like deaminating enzyme
MKVCIVGAGIMGLCTAWALKKRGHTVTLLDQSEMPNPQGASSDSSRLIRYAYGDSEGYTRMVAEAHQAWGTMWHDLEEKHYIETGTLCIASKDGDDAADHWMHRSAVTLEKCGYRPEMLEPARVALRFPLVDPTGIDAGLYLKNGGVLLADRIMDGLVDYLDEQDVTLMPKRKAVEIDLDRARVKLENGETVEADLVIVSAGAWVGKLLPGLAQRIKPSRQVVAFMHPPEELEDLWLKSPMILDIDPDEGFYATPPVGGTNLKIGDHRFTLTGDPDGSRKAKDADVASVAEHCAKRLTGWAGYRLDRLQVCYYAVAPEDRFVVEPMGKAGWVLSACSGHGFKFAAVLGQRLAEIVSGHGEPAKLSAWAAGAMP